jgi:L-alanine-DL-glutamate epimerase-like enolase superfamily enzyme
MRDAKLKLTGRGSADARRAAILALGGRVRLDANNLWKDVDCAVKELAPIARHAWAVEEPVQPRAWRGMAEIAARTGLDIIVDEGFTQRRDLDAMPADPKFIPNFRVSKLGGLLRSLDAARHAVAGGRRIIVGSQVGETSILARAGIALAAFVGASLLAYEGAYGVRLLEWDVTTPTLGFGGGGRVEVATARSGRTGLGLQPSAGFPLE